MHHVHIPSPIADVPTWLNTSVRAMPDGLTAFSVYVSTLVKETDRIYQPVNDHLDSLCHRLDSVRRTSDHTMMFGEADLLRFSIWPACPGPLVAHGCARGSA